MTVAVLLSSLVIVVPATEADIIPLKDLVTETDGTPWVDYASDTGFAGGKGTEENPYQIANAEQLALLAYYLNESANDSNLQNEDYGRFTKKFYVLTADIDLAGHEWVSISNRSGVSPDMRFAGHFDGQGHTIKNLTVTEDYCYWRDDIRSNADKAADPNPPKGITNAHQQIGLFGYVGGNAVIENFTITGSINIPNHANRSSNVAIVVAEASGFATIKNVDVYGVIDVVSMNNELPVGGVVGKANNVIIENATMNGSVTVKGGKTGVIPYAGGIAGSMTGGLKEVNCVNNADLAVHADTANSIAGGMVANAGRINTAPDYDEYGAHFINCVNNGDITVHNNPNNQRVGGIVGNVGRGSGNNMVDVSFIGCVNTGRMSLASGVIRGGSVSGINSLVGYMESQNINGQSVSCNITIRDCYAFYASDQLVQPYFYTGNTVSVNGKKVSGYFIDDSCDINFAADVTAKVKNATVRVSKDATESLLANGYALEIVYGAYKLTVASPEELSAKAQEETDAYAFTVPAQAGADVSARLVKTFFEGTDLEETRELNAKKATWSDFYTEEYHASVSIDPKVAAPGTEANPYLIYTPGQLALISKQVAYFQPMSKVFFVLASDIDLSAHEWQPIGLSRPNTDNKDYASTATICGYGHSIKGVRLTQEYYNYSQSFIGYSTGWELKDIVFDGITIRTPEQYSTAGTIKAVCGLVGAMYGGTIDNVHVKNLDIDCEIKLSTYNDVYFAGMVGYFNNNNALITNSSVSGNINIKADEVVDAKTGEPASVPIKVGGLVSRSRAGKIENSLSDVKITVASDNNGQSNSIGAGGFVGFLQSDSISDKLVIQNCMNKSDITVNYANVGYRVGAAGFIGTMTAAKGDVKIDGCINFGENKVNLLDGDLASKPYVGSAISYFEASSSSVLSVKNFVTMTSDKIVGAMSDGSSLNETDNNCVYGDLKAIVNDSAGLRLDSNGMVFSASFDQAAYDTLIGMGYTVDLGLVIAPTADLVAVNGNAALLAGGEVRIACGNNLKGGYIAGAVTGLADKLIRTDLSAIVSITISNGMFSHTIYGEFDEAGARNVLELAEAVIADRSEGYNAAEGYIHLTNEGDFSPYAPEILADLKNRYFSVD